MHTLILGAGPIGLVTSMLLGLDGHHVTVLDQDQPAPAGVRDGWREWKRPGVRQFHSAHVLAPIGYRLLQQEAPAVLTEVLGLGGQPHNMIAGALSRLPGSSPAPEDTRFDTVAARRPVLESALLASAQRTTGVAIRHGVRVASFQTAPQTRSSGLQVTGVSLESGEHLPADLVVVAGGRGGLPAQVPGLHAVPRADRNDPGFRYYTRHFRRGDSNLPEPAPWPLRHHAGVSVIVVPGDSGTWSTTLVTSGADQRLRGLARPDAWQRVAALYPGLLPWAEGEPVGEVVTMGGLRSSRPPLAPTAQSPLSGLVMLGDAWATTSPQFGLGMSLGFLHARLLRDALRTQDRPTALAARFRSDMEQLSSIYRGLSEWETHRQAEIQADMQGSTYRTPDPGWNQHLAGRFAAMHDADVMRALADIGFLLADGRKVMQRPGLLARLSRVAAQAPSRPEGPSRRTVLAAVEARAA